MRGQNVVRNLQVLWSRNFISDTKLFHGHAAYLLMVKFKCGRHLQ